jgi:gamma-glutamylputrescine oxidase
MRTAAVDSYYTATANRLEEHPRLEGSHSCDVCVVGSGYTGLSSALHLAQRGFDVIILEAARIGWGASGRNGGQLGSGQRQDQIELEALLGQNHAHALWSLAEESKTLVKSLVEKHAIHCDLKPGILHAAHKPALAEWCYRYAEKLSTEYQYPHIRPVSPEEMRDMLGTGTYCGGYLDTDSGHLHPLNYALGLGRAASDAGVRIFENTRADSYDGQDSITVRTAAGEIRAAYVVLACNGYLGTLEPRIASRIMPLNNYILATEPLSEPQAQSLIRDDVAVADTKFVINYFRLSADRRLLFGGGETYRPRFPRDIKAFVRKHMLRVYPQLVDTRVDYAWGGTLAVTMGRMPDFGRLGPQVYFAQGYSGHGVGMATLAGKLLAEAISGTAERFDLMASIPTKHFPGGRYLRWPAQVLAMLYYTLRDKF